MMKCNDQEFNCDKNQHNMNLPCWHAFLDVSIGLQLNLRLWRDSHLEILSVLEKHFQFIPLVRGVKSPDLIFHIWTFRIFHLLENKPCTHNTQLQYNYRYVRRKVHIVVPIYTMDVLDGSESLNTCTIFIFEISWDKEVSSNPMHSDSTIMLFKNNNSGRSVYCSVY
jgi:hypothetical protein